MVWKFRGSTRGPRFFELGVVAIGAVAGTYFIACAAQVTDSTDDDAGTEASPPSGPPVVYDSGPPADPYGEAGVVTPTPDGGGADGGGSDGGPTPTSCNTPGDCPGNNAHDNVMCTSHTCSLSCQGEFYDCNANPIDGCEVEDSPIDKHTQAKAVDLGSFGCTDGSSQQNINGQTPSDTQVHENPTVDGFDKASGSAPDWYKIHGTGSGICQNDANFSLHLVSAKQKQGCYRLTLFTDKNPGGQACSAGANGDCSVTNGSGSYSNDSDLFLKVEKLCAAGTSDDAVYQVTGHL